jgi:malonate-semialdehyde dehydrogenase (acetylating)/methylmalonate-semialdehyde dehydrogenase
MTSSNVDQAASTRRLQAISNHLMPRTGTQLASTSSAFPTSHAKTSQTPDTPYFLDNEFLLSNASDVTEVRDPATDNLVARVPQNTDEELQAAVDSASRAFPAWRATTVLARQRIMFQFVALIRENWERLAAVITLEQGKTLADARGDVLRGLQVAEAACSAPELLKGDLIEVAKGMETRTYREPLGVVAAICPFSEFDGSTRKTQKLTLSKKIFLP